MAFSNASALSAHTMALQLPTKAIPHYCRCRHTKCPYGSECRRQFSATAGKNESRRGVHLQRHTKRAPREDHHPPRTIIMPSTNSPEKDVSSSPLLARLAAPFSPYWTAATIASRRNKDDASSPQGFSPFVGFCFTINYILGTGFLTIPWALAQGGWLLSTLVLITVGVLSDMSNTYLLETMARAEHLLDAKLHWRTAVPASKRAGETTRLVYSPMITPATSVQDLGGMMYHQAVSSYDALESGAQKLGLEISRVHPIGSDDNDALESATTSCSSSSRGSLLGTTTSKMVHQISYDALDSAARQSAAAANGTITPNGIRRAMVVQHRRATSSLSSQQQPKPGSYLVQNERKFEVNTQCRVFLGKTGLRLYTTFICLYIYCTLWAYTSVFASAMAQTIPLRWGNNGHDVEDEDFSYLVFALVFAALVVPLSCMELHEQVTMQVALTMARFVMLAFMLGTAEQVAHNRRSSQDETIIPVPPIRIHGISSMVRTNKQNTHLGVTRHLSHYRFHCSLSVPT
jgi:Transmembrane amino acid transporter protein